MPLRGEDFDLKLYIIMITTPHFYIRKVCIACFLEASCIMTILKSMYVNVLLVIYIYIYLYL